MKRYFGALRLLVGSAVVATGMGLAAPPVAAAPALTVTPSTGLLDRSIVTVEGTGLSVDAQYLVTQCAGAAPAGCALDPPVNTNGAFVTTTGSGTMRAHLRLPRVLELEGGDVDCSTGACAIAVLRRSDNTEVTRTAIDFEPTGTATVPDATLALTLGSRWRANGGTVRWQGAGYLPWFEATAIDAPGIPISLAGSVTSNAAYIAVCTPPPSGWAGCERYVSRPTLVPGSSGATFKFTGRVSVDAQGRATDAVGSMPRMWDTDEGRIDCAVADCSFALEQDGAPHSNVADVAWLPEWAPYPSAAAFVAAAYPALLGRPATASERSAAIAGLTDRSITGYRLLLDLAGRSDARRLAEITRLYTAALGRQPDGAGLVYWEQELERTGSMSAIAEAFGRTPEFRRTFGAANVTDAVEMAYVRTLNRYPTGKERQYWIDRLRAGLARTHMIHLFSRSPEFVAREDGRSRVAAITVALLRRGPTADEWYLVNPDWVYRDTRGRAERVDDGVLLILSSNQLDAEV